MAVSSPGPRRGDCRAIRTGGGGGAIAAADMPPTGSSMSSVVAAPAAPGWKRKMLQGLMPADLHSHSAHMFTNGNSVQWCGGRTAQQHARRP
jgi:hypothetical protein